MLQPPPEIWRAQTNRASATAGMQGDIDQVSRRDQSHPRSEGICTSLPHVRDGESPPSMADQADVRQDGSTATNLPQPLRSTGLREEGYEDDVRGTTGDSSEINEEVIEPKSSEAELDEAMSGNNYGMH